MTLMQTWCDSLLLFLPRQFKPFFLVTVKTIGSIYYILFTRLWWIIMLDVALFFGTSLIGHWLQFSLQLIAFYLFISGLFLFFIIILAMRPSVLQKDTHYFVSYLPYFFYVLIFMVLMIVITAIISVFSVAFLPLFLLLGNSIIISPLVIFFILFLLDSDGSLTEVVKSMGRSIKMAWYNYPFCIISFMFFCCLFFPLVTWMIDYISFAGHSIITSLYAKIVLSSLTHFLYFWVCMPVAIAFIGNFYVKMIYPQMSLYFLVIKRDD